jgi:2-dehydro-3-deoxyphosphogluconate aldolase / (4S)-4-hydroxy-2-oxoglutarate aldolase
MNPSHLELIDRYLNRAPVLPVLSIDDLGSAVALARTLVEAGLPVLEITLRTPVALAAISAIARDVPDAIIGAGTVLSAADLRQVAEAGAQFAISPGATPALYASVGSASIPWIPAIATASELMLGLEHGHQRFKFFPAVPSGGIGALKAFAGPFAKARFCPTGGIDASTAAGFLALPNVITVGGSWMVPAAALAASDWSTIGALARTAAALKS